MAKVMICGLLPNVYSNSIIYEVLQKEFCQYTVQMKIKFFLATIIIYLTSVTSLLSSELPPCNKTQSPSTYDNCFGSYDINGHQYVGSFKNGLRHGQGMYRMPNGNLYSGFFEKDAFQGLGHFIFASGSWYIGNWETGQTDGLGMYVFVSEEEQVGVYIGHYKEGKKHGKGLYVEPNGNADICIYENDYHRSCYGQTILDVGTELLMNFSLLTEEEKFEVQKNLNNAMLYQGEISGKWNIETFVALVGFAAIYLETFKFEYADEAQQLLSKVLDY